jgi:hypothetical protein
MREAITMVAPREHARFYVTAPDGKSRRYEADHLALIRNVAQIHVAGLRASGCREFVRPQLRQEALHDHD